MKNFKIPSNLAVSESGFLFSPSTGETFTLNTIGLNIFKMLQKGNPPDEIIQHITEVYDVEKFSFERDFTDFVNMLKTYNLVEEL